MLIRTAIYLDSNAGAPLKHEALEVLLSSGLFRFDSQAPQNSRPFFLPNPSSIHSHGRSSKRLLADAREKIAFSIGPKTDPEQLVFTSSGTEANQLAIRSVLEPKLAQGLKPHWITTPVEHDSVKQMIEWLESQGGSVSVLPVNSQGLPVVDSFSEWVRPETALASVLWVNNETGGISDISRLAELTRKNRIPLHVDAAQAWGKLSFDVNSIGAQFISFSGHKIGALAGTGVLWLERGTQAQPLIRGKQEKGRRGGTENLLGIVTMGAAAQCISPTAWAERVAPLRDRLQNTICERIPGTWVNGGEAPRVANTLNLSFDGVEGDGLVMALDLAGYSVSSGSACASGVLEPSHVLLAMGRSRSQAMAAIRISLVDEIPWESLEGFVKALEQIVGRVRKAGSTSQ